MTHVAWLGLGAMGLAMAPRLLGTASELAVYDPLGDRARALAERGARAAASPAEAAAGAEVVMVMVATPDQAIQALFGEGGAAGALEPGSSVVVMSTIGPGAVRELAERLA